jgi:hypothetical protein
VDAHRPLGDTLRLESILSRVEQRQVTNDYTVALDGKRWQIPKEAVRAGLRKSKLRIEARLDGRLQCSQSAGCNRSGNLTRPKRPAAAGNLIPLSRFPPGKPGRAGSPHAGYTGSPHKRSSAPLCIPRGSLNMSRDQ